MKYVDINALTQEVQRNPNKKAASIALMIVDGIVLLSTISEGLVGLIWGIAGCMIIDSIIWMIWGACTKCPHCKRPFAMRKDNKQYLGEQSTTKTVKQNIRNNKGEIIGSYDQTVPAVRSYYIVTYRCMYCNGIKKTNTSYTR